MMIAALVFPILTGATVAFQLAVATGAPWGRLTWGGKFPGTLPPRMRAVAVFSSLLLVGFGIMVAIRAGLFTVAWAPLARRLIWAVVACCALGASAIDAAAQERIAPFGPRHVKPDTEYFQIGPAASEYHSAAAGDTGSGGLLFGGLVGAVAGAGLGYLIPQGSTEGCDDGMCGWVVPTMVGGATGLVIGSWFGYRVAVGQAGNESFQKARRVQDPPCFAAVHRLTKACGGRRAVRVFSSSGFGVRPAPLSLGR